MIRRFSTWRYQLRARWKRLYRAVAYATGHLSCDDAQWLMLDCESVAGLHPLMTLRLDDVLDMAADTYGDTAGALAPYLLGACEYVARKWDPTGDEYWQAREWALDTALEAAAQDGIQLYPLSPDGPEDTANTFSQGENAHA